jgi:hypothetical protein
MVSELYALCFAIWVAIAPSLAREKAAPEIARTVAELVAADPSPVFGSAEEEAAVFAYYAFRESTLRPWAVGDGGLSWGIWQVPHEVALRGIRAQGVYWLRRLHDGARECSASPAAPVSGGCEAARKPADRAVRRALVLLATVRATQAPSVGIASSN